MRGQHVEEAPDFNIAAFTPAKANPGRILSVDDDPNMRDLIARYLAEAGFQVSQADGLQSARAILASEKINVVLLDIVLVGESGMDLIADLRKTFPSVGLIMLTSRNNLLDRVLGLELGADDYIAKPVKMRELLARIRSVIRRIRTSPEQPASEVREQEVVRFAGWRFDLAGRRLTDPGGNDVPLTSGEFTLLKAFVGRPGHVLDRDHLANLTKGRDWNSLDRTIDAQVSRLRKKIEPDCRNPTVIKSVRGRGYIFVAKIQ